MTGRRVRHVAVVVAVLVVVGGVGDRILLSLARSRLAKQATCQLHARSSSVGIGGRFLLPQIVRGRYTHITVRSRGVRESGGPVDLTADLHDVRQAGHNRLNAGHGRISVIVPFSTVAAGAGPGESASASGGQLVFSATTGQAAYFRSTAYADVSLDHSALVVTPVRLTLDGRDVPWARAKRLAIQAGQSLAPRRVSLPTSLTRLGLTAATATPNGLLLQASGPDMHLVLPSVAGCG